MIPHVLSWAAVTLDCLGHQELAISYIVPMAVGAMVFTGWCPLDENGNVQPCPVWLDISFETSATSAALADPGVGQVVMWKDPVAVDGAGNRSDDPGGCSP